MKRILCIGGENAKYSAIFAEHGMELLFINTSDEDAIAAAARGIEAIIFSAQRFTSALFDKLPDLKILSRAGIGI